MVPTGTRTVPVVMSGDETMAISPKVADLEFSLFSSHTTLTCDLSITENFEFSLRMKACVESACDACGCKKKFVAVIVSEISVPYRRKRPTSLFIAGITVCPYKNY